MTIPFIIGKPALRGIASRILVVSLAVSAFVLLVPSMEESHIASVGSALPKIGLGVLLGLFTLALRRNKYATLALTLVLSTATLYLFATSPHNQHRYERAMGSHDVVGRMVDELESDPASRRILDQQQMILFEASPSASIRTKISFMYPLELELWRRGYAVCNSAFDWGLGRGGQSPPLLHCPVDKTPRWKLLFGVDPKADPNNPPIFSTEVGEGINSPTEEVTLLAIPRD